MSSTITRAGDSAYRYFRLVGRISVGASILIGLLYVIGQWLVTGEVQDPIFVGILMANGFALHTLLLYFINHFTSSAEAISNSLSDKDVSFEAGEFIGDLFNRRRSVTTGLIFGTLFLAAVMTILQVWEDNRSLRTLLGLFLFSTNFITGMAVYSLFIYYRKSLELGDLADIDLWDRSCSIFKFLVDTNSYLVLSVGYICFAATISLVFSVFEFTFSLTFFSIWSLVVLVTTFIVPLIPVSKRIRDLKVEHTEKLAVQRQIAYDRVSDSLISGGDLDTSKLDAIRTLQNEIKSVRVFPPVGAKSVETAIVVTILTVLPSLVDFVLNLIEQ